MNTTDYVDGSFSRAEWMPRDFSFVRNLLLKLRHPFAGLVFWTLCSDGQRMLVSQHYPHLLCWSWMVRWIGLEGPKLYFFRPLNFCGYARIGPLAFNWQRHRIPSLTYRRRVA
jgi:hypothetical protein